MSSSYLQSINRRRLVSPVHTNAARLFNGGGRKRPRCCQHYLGGKGTGAADAAAAPRWTWYTDDGLPNVESVMAQFKFLSQSMKMVSGKVTPDMLFDLVAAKEATQRLKTANPFT
jgi:hypothetical protein